MSDPRDTALRALVVAVQAYLTAVNSDRSDWAHDVESTRAKLATLACKALPYLSTLLAEAERPAPPAEESVLAGQLRALCSRYWDRSPAATCRDAVDETREHCIICRAADALSDAEAERPAADGPIAACARVVMQSADDSAAYLSVKCTCGKCHASPAPAAVDKP